MKKNVWIMNHYAGNMYFDRGGRHYNFAKYLKQMGYEPVVFCANSKHGPPETWFPQNDLWHVHTAEEIGVPFVFIRARTYIGNGKQRIMNMVDFYHNLKKTSREYACKNGSPNIIYASSVHPLTLLAGIQLAKFFGIECVCEMRDIWPEGLVAVDPKTFSPQKPLIKLLYQGEKWIYTRANRLVFTVPGGYDYIQEKKWEKAIPCSKVFYINNGIDLPVFDKNRDLFRISDPDLDDPAVFKVIYTGTIRRVNNLGIILDAAKLLKNHQIKILIWGDGDELPALRDRIQTENITNVVFKGRVEKKYIPYIVSKADLNLVHWQMLDTLRFGVSYNKLFEYLAAGKPIFSTVRPGYSIVENQHCGVDTEGFAPRDLADGIQRMASLTSEELEQMGKNSRAAALEYDFSKLTETLVSVIEDGSAE